MKIDTDDIASWDELAEAGRALRDAALRLNNGAVSATSIAFDEASLLAEFERSEEYRIMRDLLDKGAIFG